MRSSDIAHQRLLNQHIIRAIYKKPADVVNWLGTVQAQDYAGAKWALGLRLQNATDEDVEQAFTDGEPSFALISCGLRGILLHRRISAGCLPSRLLGFMPLTLTTIANSN